MKTPIQELIEQLREQAQLIAPDDCVQDKFYKKGLLNAIKYAEAMLEKEKEVIADAYEAGSHTEWNEDTWMLVEKQDYYNETFNTKDNG